MSYYKVVKDGYVVGVGIDTKDHDFIITKQEYDTLVNMAKQRPLAPDGYEYRLTESLEWEKALAPKNPTTEEVLTAEEALAILTGGDSNAEK